MARTDIAGLKIDAITKPEFLSTVETRIKAGQKTFVTTVYSEFLYAALRDRAVLTMLNQADIAVADGIAIPWAAMFLKIPFTVRNYYLKILEACWQAKYSLAAILFRPKWVKSVIPEKIVGADIAWDIAEMAARNNWSVYLLGGFGDTPKLVADKLISESANRLTVAGWSNKGPDDATVIDEIKSVNPDILLVAYGPLRQEQWITEHKEKLPTKLYIGLGGTFDYIAGKRRIPPKFVRYTGLEWLFRLITQPRRIKRIWQATVGLITTLIRYKVFTSLPYRDNVVSIILNQNNQVLIAQRDPDEQSLKSFGFKKEELADYWQFPQGGRDKGESIADTATRECFEELGIKSVEYLRTSDQVHSYEWMNGRRRLWWGSSHFKGQRQNIAYVRFTGPDSEFKLRNEPHDQEFIAYKWVNMDQLVESVHKDRRPLAKMVLDDLKNFS